MRGAKEWDDYLTKGVQVLQGEKIPERKEIDSLNDVELYLLREGFAKFQNVSQDDPDSWFQIAGIHGLPYDIWPRKDWNEEIPKSTGGGGFCTHTSILFLTWHRPYLALFEQILYRHVKKIAEGVKDDPKGTKQKYVDAAKTFRLPYWDWAKPLNAADPNSSPYFPKAALSKSYNRTKLPKSSESWFDQNPTKPVYNPLFQAPFSMELIKGWRQEETIAKGKGFTIRYPGDSNSSESLLSALAAYYRDDLGNFPKSPNNPFKRTNVSERVSYILKSYLRYGPMSNNAYRRGLKQPDTANAETWGSLEDCHNSIHVATGGGGNMGSVPIAAFDPIFWLHHCNIDRLFAIWQALNAKLDKDSDAWVQDKAAGESNWTTLKGGMQGRDSPLYPFKPENEENSWYNSRNEDGTTSVRRTTTFGYTYPETKDISSYPAEGVKRETLLKDIDKLYNPPSTAIQQSIAGDPKAGEQFLSKAAMLQEFKTNAIVATHEQMKEVVLQLPEPPQLLEQFSGPGKRYLRDLAPGNSYLEWLVNAKALKHSHGGQYEVHFFLGPVQEDNISLWPLSPNYVASFVPFGQDSDTPCEKCQQDQADELEVTSQIPLTGALMERYLVHMVETLEERHVVPFLTENLHWRVVLNGNVADDRSSIEGLKVFVVSNKVTLPEDPAQPPVYDFNVTIHPEITTKTDGTGRGDGTGLVGHVH
ncbi:Di-copper centre-containing protein [Polyplosphaeria fusca]|uniref:tyrosinase n=1 Tax=Polyplosphaeria fusca TaxID=682080 RepID=A0A9P4V8T4_9PLEO|nr:Di-copper centre-containing protein [Polyplosphaeria fusca]